MWPREALDRDAIDQILQNTDNELSSFKAMLDSNQFGMNSSSWESFVENTRERIEKLENFKNLQKWLAQKDLIAAEVRADGNCGVWSMLAKDSNNPFYPASQNADAARDLREAVAQLWFDRRDCPQMQYFFASLYEKLTADSEPTDSKNVQPKDSSQVKEELKVTPKKRRAGPPIFVDLCTPPKKESHPEVLVEGAQRGAMTKKQKSNPIIKGIKADVSKEVPHESGGDRSLVAGIVGKLPRPRRRQNERVAQEEVQEGRDSNAECDDANSKKKKRVRLCKKKEWTEDDKKLGAVRTYLGSIGVTYLTCQAFHAQNSVSGAQCKEYTNLFQNLLEEKMPECVVCQALLRQRSFSMEEMRNLVENATNPHCLSPRTQKLTELHRMLKDDRIDEEHPLPISMGSAPAQEPIEQPSQAIGEEQMVVAEAEPANADAEANPENEAVTDVFGVREVIKQCGQHMVLSALELGTHDKRVPIKCRVCRSRAFPFGKIFEAHCLKHKVLCHFINQHCGRPTHLSFLRRFASTEAVDMQKPSSDTVPSMIPCEGMSLTHSSSRISTFRAELLRWARFTKIKTVLRKHTYLFDVSSEELKVFHEDCQKIVQAPDNGSRAICPKCQDRDLVSTPLRCCLKLCYKYWAALILRATLFSGTKGREDVIEECKRTQMYKSSPEKVDFLLQKDAVALQKFVRNSWLKTPRTSSTDLLLQFIDSTVKPCLNVNPVDCTDDMQCLSNNFAAMISSKQFRTGSLEDLTLKVLKSTAQGKVSKNAAVMGIIMQCLDVVDRESRGISTLKSTRVMDDLERDMVQEAASLLASNGCSADLMKRLGFSRESALRNHGKLVHLLEQGLPSPCLSLLFPGVLEQNMTLIDTLIPRPSSVRKKRFAVQIHRA